MTFSSLANDIQGYNCFGMKVYNIQPWRRLVYLLQVLHLCFWHFTWFKPFAPRAWNTVFTYADPLKIDGEPVMGLPGNSRTDIKNKQHIYNMMPNKSYLQICFTIHNTYVHETIVIQMFTA